MGPGSAQQRHERSARHLALCPAERNGSAWRMIYLASPLPRRLVVSQCPPWITRQDVHSRLKNAKSQRNKKSLICSEGEPTLLSIHTDKDVEIAAPLLTRKGAEKRLIARRRAEQVQTGYTWTTDGVYLGNRRKSRRELRQRDKYGHLQAAQSSKAGRKKRK